MTSTNGLNNTSKEKIRDMFLQEVSNCKDPVATWARYRTVENGLAFAITPNDVSVNTINVNMSRGTHEHILLLRTIACYHKGKNPSARVTPLVKTFKVNNNSATVDSVISSVQNEISFLQKCNNCSANSIFNILPKAEFKSHKYLTTVNADHFSTYHKVTDTRNSIPIKGIEMQVHQQSFNCSAISGPQLLEIICEIVVDLLNYANCSDNITIDICLVNAKALCEKLSNSLIIPRMNDFCEILCRKLGSYKMTLKNQMKLYQNKVSLILRKIFMTRDNYATAGTFSTFFPSGNKLVGSKLLTTDDMSILSHKYGSEATDHIFQLMDETEMPPKLVKFRKKVQEFANHPLHRNKILKTSLNMSENKTGRKNKKYIKKKRKRTGGIIYNAALCQQRYIQAFQNHNIPLPTEDEL